MNTLQELPDLTRPAGEQGQVLGFQPNPDGETIHFSINRSTTSPVPDLVGDPNIQKGPSTHIEIDGREVNNKTLMGLGSAALPKH